MQQHHATSSEALMARYQDCLDAEAFEQIVSRFLAPALAVAQQIVRDRGLAEDAVQETFLRIVRSRERYLASRPFSTWLYAILRNVCRDTLRRHARHADLLRRVAALGAKQGQPPPSDSLDAMELLGELPAEARAVLSLRIVHGLPFRDVAAALGISEEAAKKRAQRALRRLRSLRSVREFQGGDARPREARRTADDGVPAR